MKQIGVDKSAGPDGVLMRIMKSIDNLGHMHADIAANIMRLGYYPGLPAKARTCLLHKGGNEQSNWRPITIFFDDETNN